MNGCQIIYAQLLKTKDHFASLQSDSCVCIKYGRQYVWLLYKKKFSISFDDRKGGKKEVCKVIK